MAASDTTSLQVERREPQGSRATRRLRRSGRVPGVVYGGGDDPITFEVDARLLRNALAHGGAVIDLSVEGAAAEPVVVKDEQHHPVSGGLLHVDLLRGRLDRAIEATTILELVGREESPWCKDGGVVRQEAPGRNMEVL